MTMPARQLARVAVDDETWRAFRQAALTRDVSIAAYLAELVEREEVQLQVATDRPMRARIQWTRGFEAGGQFLDAPELD